MIELATTGLIDLQIARERLDNTALHPTARERAAGLLQTLGSRTIGRSGPTRDASRNRVGCSHSPDGPGKSSPSRPVR